MTLVELDDVGVTKDHTQAEKAGTSWQRPDTARPTHPPPAIGRAPTPSPRRLEVPAKLGDTLAKLSAAIARDEATDAAMKFVSGRSIAALLLLINDGLALSTRSHGPQLSEDAVQAVAIPLTAPSIVKAAHDERTLISEPPTHSE